MRCGVWVAVLLAGCASEVVGTGETPPIPEGRATASAPIDDGGEGGTKVPAPPPPSGAEVQSILTYAVSCTLSLADNDPKRAWRFRARLHRRSDGGASIELAPLRGWIASASTWYVPRLSDVAAGEPWRAEVANGAIEIAGAVLPAEADSMSGREWRLSGVRIAGELGERDSCSSLAARASKPYPYDAALDPALNTCHFVLVQGDGVLSTDLRCP